MYLIQQCDNSADWKLNGAGFYHSHQHGFGLLNAWRLVNAAKVHAWTHTSGCNHSHVLMFDWSVHYYLNESLGLGNYKHDFIIPFKRFLSLSPLSQVWESVPFLVSYQSSVIKEKGSISTYPDESIRTWKGNSLCSSLTLSALYWTAACGVYTLHYDAGSLPACLLPSQSAFPYLVTFSCLRVLRPHWNTGGDFSR